MLGVANAVEASLAVNQWVTWAHLTLKRLSLLTISPSLRHPLLLERSNTSHNLLSSGSFSTLILLLRSGHSDMATCGWRKFHHQRVASRRAFHSNFCRGHGVYFLDNTGKPGRRTLTTLLLLLLLLPVVSHPGRAATKGCLGAKTCHSESERKPMRQSNWGAIKVCIFRVFIWQEASWFAQDRTGDIYLYATSRWGE